MERRLKWIAFVSLVVLGVFTAEGRSSAHHSFAMFDFTKVTTFHATIKEFQWSNPHVILSFVVDGDAEEPQVWWAELTSPGNLTRVGWSKRAFKAGDRVEIAVHPLRDGTHGGAFVKATLAETGQVWTSDLRAQEKPEIGIVDPSRSGSSEPSDPGAVAQQKKSGCSFSGMPPEGHEAPAVLVGILVFIAILRHRWRPIRG